MKWELDLWYELWDRAGSQGLDTWYDLEGGGRDGPGNEPNADGPDVARETPSEGG